MTIDHLVEPLPDDEGAIVAIAIDAPGPLEAVLARTYGPVMRGLLERLAQTAVETEAAGG